MTRAPFATARAARQQAPQQLRRAGRQAGLLLVVAALAACASPPPPPPAAPPPGLTDVLDRPAERALFDGMRAYDEGAYETAESALRSALAAGLRSPRDRATAHKLMAFIHCSSNREMQCETAFRQAREADPAFALSRAEAGHPLWGPVFRRLTRQSGATPR